MVYVLLPTKLNGIWLIYTVTNASISIARYAITTENNNCPGGDVCTMTAPWSMVVYVAQLVAETSAGAGGDLRLAAVTSSSFRWRNSDTKISVMGGISLVYYDNLFRIYLHSDDYRSSLLCLHRCEFSMWRYQSLCMCEKEQLKLIGTEAGRRLWRLLWETMQLMCLSFLKWQPQPRPAIVGSHGNCFSVSETSDR